ncbi:uncharacterized protein LOC119190185 [Manduca sexta]|uniref:uncharacterized protein LOC119190185 n=1 Tax=Manduca sexta TaxID=7130 RepID=UPI001890A6E9|nr:uncharacterized protein LOC119190185 [Manduca sexta]
MDISKQINIVTVSQYADDFVLYTTNQYVSDSVRILQTALNNFVYLLHDIGLDISPTKSKVCIFQKGYKKYSFQVKVDGFDVQLSPYVKYLGVWLDCSLRWSKHINEISEKASKYLNLLKILAGSGWGVHPKHLRYIYMAMVRSRLDYASFLFDDSAQCHTSKLDKIQNAAMRIIGSFLKTTPIHVMESELCLQPLTIRRRYLGGKYLFKCKSLHFNSNILSSVEDGCRGSHTWNRKKEPLLWKLQKLFRNVRVNCSALLDMFAMKYWANIGASFFDPQTNSRVRFKIHSDISIMSAELVAILEACSYAESISYNNIVVITDSKSALQHFARSGWRDGQYPDNGVGWRSSPLAAAVVRFGRGGPISGGSRFCPGAWELDGNPKNNKKECTVEVELLSDRDITLATGRNTASTSTAEIRGGSGSKPKKAVAARRRAPARILSESEPSSDSSRLPRRITRQSRKPASKRPRGVRTSGSGSATDPVLRAAAQKCVGPQPRIRRRMTPWPELKAYQSALREERVAEAARAVEEEAALQEVGIVAPCPKIAAPKSAKVPTKNLLLEVAENIRHVSQASRNLKGTFVKALRKMPPSCRSARKSPPPRKPRDWRP